MLRPVILILFALQCCFCLRAVAEQSSAYQEMKVPRPGGAYAYRLLRPLPTTGKFPLVLFLHGAGERGNDNLAQLKFLPTALATPALRERFPCFVLAPQCAQNQQWVDAPWGDKVSKPMAEKPSIMLANAIAAFEQVRQDPQVDTSRLYLTGLSMGGYGAWELAIRHPEWWAAAAPICGGGDESKVGTLKELPLWAFHGSADTVVWPVRSQGMIDALRAAGGQPKFTMLERVGHNAWDPAYSLPSGLLEWMFLQRRVAK